MNNMSFNNKHLSWALATRFYRRRQVIPQTLRYRLRWTAGKAFAAMLLLFLSLPASADSFYVLIGFRCDASADTLTITYDGAYNDAGKAMLENKRPTQWDPWKLISMRDDDHIGESKTMRRTCRLSDGAYEIRLWAAPGNSNVQGRCGAHMSAGAEVKRGKRLLSRIDSFEPDCHDVDAPIINRVVIRPGSLKGIEARVPHDEFYK